MNTLVSPFAHVVFPRSHHPGSAPVVSYLMLIIIITNNNSNNRFSFPHGEEGGRLRTLVPYSQKHIHTIYACMYCRPHHDSGGERRAKAETYVSIITIIIIMLPPRRVHADRIGRKKYVCTILWPGAVLHIY